MNKRSWLKAMAVLAAATACDRVSLGQGRGQLQSARFGSGDAFPASITLDMGSRGAPANARLCGSNVQWVDAGDGLLPRSGTSIVPDILDKVKLLAPTVIRYPGGSQSDVYHWRAGVGKEETRRSNEHFHRKDKQIVRLGTAEFLTLCEATGAEPLITTNVGTGSAQDAADWVRQTNVSGLTSLVSGKRLPSVPYWEIGNEPYLKEDKRAETWMEPGEYARRANAFMRAMREADAGIKIGIPLRSDSFNGSIPVTPHQGFNQRVLPLLKEPFDFVSLHNAYLPFLYDKVPDDGEIYAGLMGASATVRGDLDATRAQLHKLLGRAVPIAITEYNALVTLGKRQDNYLAAPAGALYVADLLRLFAAQPDILMANHWSLIGNWEFGALSSSGQLRPVYDVLRFYRQTLRGEMLGLEVRSKDFSAPRIGLMREADKLPVITATATREAGTLRLLLLNKDPQATATAGIQLSRGKFGAQVGVRSLTASAPFAAPDKDNAFLKKQSTQAGGSALLSVVLPPCSLTLIESLVT